LDPPEIEIELDPHRNGPGSQSDLQRSRRAFHQCKNATLDVSGPSACFDAYCFLRRFCGIELVELLPSEKWLLELSGNKLRLMLHFVEEVDFGLYSCTAENNLSRSSQKIELSGEFVVGLARGQPNRRLPRKFHRLI